MVKKTDIFKPDGTLKGLYYCKSSGGRGPALTLQMKAPAKGAMLSVHQKNFPQVYAEIVKRIAEAHSIGAKTKLYSEMIDSQGAFLEANGLDLQVVTESYLQVQAA